MCNDNASKYKIHQKWSYWGCHNAVMSSPGPIQTSLPNLSNQIVYFSLSVVGRLKRHARLGHKKEQIIHDKRPKNY